MANPALVSSTQSVAVDSVSVSLAIIPVTECVSLNWVKSPTRPPSAPLCTGTDVACAPTTSSISPTCATASSPSHKLTASARRRVNVRHSERPTAIQRHRVAAYAVTTPWRIRHSSCACAGLVSVSSVRQTQTVPRFQTQIATRRPVLVSARPIITRRTRLVDQGSVPSAVRMRIVE